MTGIAVPAEGPATATPEAGGHLPSSAVPAVTAAQMADVDRLAIETYGITLLQMMEQAGSHLAEVVRREMGGDLVGRRVVVAVGPGNNGGGGLVAARHLANRGAIVRVILAGLSAAPLLLAGLVAYTRRESPLATVAAMVWLVVAQLGAWLLAG